jgi:hypothetical protein
VGEEILPASSSSESVLCKLFRKQYSIVKTKNCSLVYEWFSVLNFNPTFYTSKNFSLHCLEWNQNVSCHYLKPFYNMIMSYKFLVPKEPHWTVKFCIHLSLNQFYQSIAFMGSKYLNAHQLHNKVPCKCSTTSKGYWLCHWVLNLLTADCIYKIMALLHCLVNSLLFSIFCPPKCINLRLQFWKLQFLYY